MPKILLFFAILLINTNIKADDGYRLWLKYDKIQNIAQRTAYSNALKSIVIMHHSPTIYAAAEELQLGLSGLLGKSMPIKKETISAAGDIILQIEHLAPADSLNERAKEGYRFYKKDNSFIIAGKSDAGVLYGVFAFLRHLQTLKPLDNYIVASTPKIQYRLLNHWDNVNGTIERGYAGASLWKWYDLPETIDPRYKDYARANASIGINGTVLNNVNASARFMTAEYLQKVAALAAIFRPYHIKVFLSVRFSAPSNIGGLPTSDPLDPAVQAWWKEKTKEIYTIIPDFGGFLVKANSEGEPGPQDYGRDHADGANMLADAIAPYNGVVMWRAFVYKPDPKSDRTKAAYQEFQPLDGKFRKNVIVQVKNGAIDFQPREPFHPLFGAMPQTPLAMEFQITQEYLGFATQWAYLAPLFKETLSADTHVNKDKNSTVAKIIDGSLYNYAQTAMVGVANTGSDRNWCGHIGNQSNWYAFGRLAWDYELTSENIADEWVKMSLTTHPKSVETIKKIMLATRETIVNYMTPLGLHHIMGQNIHFGPEPWLEKSARPDWTSVYYHRADSIGVGFNRTESGSNALSLYAPEAQAVWKDAKNCPLEDLLWFHHIGWNEKLKTGKTLWEELCTRYYTGAETVIAWQKEWQTVQPNIDKETFSAIENKLKVQHREAIWWRDACVLYFQQFSKQEIPTQFVKPTRTLDEIKKVVELYQLR
jgi:alpha-glucuronidase